MHINPVYIDDRDLKKSMLFVYIYITHGLYFCVIQQKSILFINNSSIFIVVKIWELFGESWKLSRGFVSYWKKKLNGKHIGPSSLISEIKLKTYVTYFSE